MKIGTPIFIKYPSTDYTAVGRVTEIKEMAEHEKSAYPERSKDVMYKVAEAIRIHDQVPSYKVAACAVPGCTDFEVVSEEIMEYAENNICPWNEAGQDKEPPRYTLSKGDFVMLTTKMGNIACAVLEATILDPFTMQYKAIGLQEGMLDLPTACFPMYIYFGPKKSNVTVSKLTQTRNPNVGLPMWADEETCIELLNKLNERISSFI